MKKVVQVDGELLQKLKIYCAQYNLKIGETVERLIKKLLQGEKENGQKKSGKTKERD